MKILPPEQLRRAKYKIKNNFYNPRLRLKETRKELLTQAPTSFVVISKKKKRSKIMMMMWFKETLGGHEEDRHSLHGRPIITRNISVYPPGLGQHEDSPQHQGPFFLLSFGLLLFWLVEADSHLHWWEVEQVSGWEPLPSSCHVAGDHVHPQWPSGNQAEIKRKVLAEIWHVNIPIHSIYNLGYHTINGFLKVHQMASHCWYINRLLRSLR